MTVVCTLAATSMYSANVQPHLLALYRYFLNPDLDAFPNYTNVERLRAQEGGQDLGSNPTADVSQHDFMGAQLMWSWDSQEKGYNVTSLTGTILNPDGECEAWRIRCRPDPKKVDPVTKRIVPAHKIPKHRYPSTATPGFYVTSKPAVKTEDDVIYRPNLPTFGEQSKQKDAASAVLLSQRDSELLLSFLTVPYLRLPLVLTFFASEDRVHKLQSRKLRDILSSVCFEPGRHLSVLNTGVLPAMVPTTHPRLLATPYGHLLNELACSPANVMRSIVALLTGALALDTGAVCDWGGSDFNTGVEIILYVTRLVARMENFISFLIDTRSGRHPCLSDVKFRGVDLSDDTIAELEDGLQRLHDLMQGQVAPLLEEYLLKLDRQTAASPGDEKLIDRNSRLSCDLHAHRLLLYRNVYWDELSAEDAECASKVVIGSFVYLTTRHTWNKAARDQGRLLVPETELYELLQVVRRRLIRWVQCQRQGALDTVLQTALQVSSSTTGSSDVEIDKSNRWASLAGANAEGRYAVSSTRTIAAMKSSKSDSDADDGADSGQELTRASSSLAEVAEVAHTAMLGVEMDLQIGQMTLRSKHLQALRSTVANHPDVKLIFGENTMQASLLERAEHRKKFRLVGLQHELEVWQQGHNDCPPLGEEWDREYDPSELEPSERWIAKLFEPVRKSFFNGPTPPPMQFMMAERVHENAEIAVLIGLHQQLGGPFKLVWIHRRLKCVQIFECVSQGRQWWFTLHLTTDSRYCLRDLQPSCDPRKEPYPAWWERGAGSPYPKGLSNKLANNLLNNAGDHLYSSVLIKRDAADARNLSGGVETFVPKRFLLGVIPQSLLDTYLFWQDEAIEPTAVLNGHTYLSSRISDDDDDDGELDLGTTTDDASFPPLNPGYRRLRGYARADAKGCEDTMILLEFQSIGSWADDQQKFAEESTGNVVDATRLPGRTVRVVRLPLESIKADIEQRKRIAACLETLQLLVPQSTATKLEAAKRRKKMRRSGKSMTQKQKRDSNGATEGAAFPVGSVVEFDTDGSAKTWVQAEILKVHPCGKLFDIDPKEAWVGRQMRVPQMFLRTFDSAANDSRVRSNNIIQFDGISDSEDEEWLEDIDEQLAARSAQPSNEQRDEADVNRKNNALAFDQLDRLQYVLAAAGDEATCLTICRQLALGRTKRPFTDVRQLANAVANEAESSPELKEHVAKARRALATQAEIDASNSCELLNMVTAPRRSRLHSLLKTLGRIENAGHILAWVKRSSIRQFVAVTREASAHSMLSWSQVSSQAVPWWTLLASSKSGDEYCAIMGNPAIDLVELPRLKLSFTVRKDYTGVERLYSLDHSDLFVCNKRKPLVNSMIQGIPHSLLLSNLEGELQVLVPIVNPKRPQVLSEPFSTALVLDRSDATWNNALGSRFFLYPVHVSTSFLLTKGLHAAMYLLLLRLLHRDYDQVFRLTDSISTDTELAPEGKCLHLPPNIVMFISS